MSLTKPLGNELISLAKNFSAPEARVAGWVSQVTDKDLSWADNVVVNAAITDAWNAVRGQPFESMEPPGRQLRAGLLAQMVAQGDSQFSTVIANARMRTDALVSPQFREVLKAAAALGGSVSRQTVLKWYAEVTPQDIDWATKSVTAGRLQDAKNRARSPSAGTTGEQNFTALKNALVALQQSQRGNAPR